MNLGVVEVLAGFIYCLQENGPKKASSCFEEFMVFLLKELNFASPYIQRVLRVFSRQLCHA